MHILSVIAIIFVVGLSSYASSRSAYWNAVLCRLWLIATILWIPFAYWMTAELGKDGLYSPNWTVVIVVPIAVLLFGAALHWAFSSWSDQGVCSTLDQGVCPTCGHDIGDRVPLRHRWPRESPEHELLGQPRR